jgi:hypothetical protein
LVETLAKMLLDNLILPTVKYMFKNPKMTIKLDHQKWTSVSKLETLSHYSLDQDSQEPTHSKKWLRPSHKFIQQVP